MQHLFDMRPDRPGYRLHRLEVFNWGTFDSADGRIHRFEPEGRTSLLVGHNGSGKSTLVDAILTLLVDSRSRNYNVAAGAKKTERTPKSYIKGAYDRTADEQQGNVVRYLRPKGNQLTALSAVFRDEQLGKVFTLTQVLYLKADGSDDKVYAIADTEHELKEDLAGLTRSDEVREHLKQRGYTTTRTYVEYHNWITRRTSMRPKGVDMFNQTVHVKDIQSLNHFIRRHMLEEQDWPEKIQRLLAHFADLSIAHQELVRARRGQELLGPVESTGGKYREQAAELERLERQLAAATSYFPLELVRLLEPLATRLDGELAAIVSALGRMDLDLADHRETLRQLRNEIDQVGGERLKQIPPLVKIEQAHFSHKQQALARLRQALEACGIEAPVDTAENFAMVRGRLATIIAQSQETSRELTSRFEEIVGQRREIARQLDDERQELAALSTRTGNLPASYSAMRSALCERLNLAESELPFAAELIAVAAAERTWEGSIEMVLRPFALSLLVPERHFRQVRDYVESQRLTGARGEGQRLDYLAVGKPAPLAGDRIDRESLVQKLEFKRHELASWVRSEIVRRFDFRCCRDVAEFATAPKGAITPNRHVKYNAQRHQKDDRPRAADPRHFVLGWDNTAKKKLLAERIAALEGQLATFNKQAANLSAERDKLEAARQGALEASRITDFDAIDTRRHERLLAALAEEQQRLLEGSETLKSLGKRVKQTERDLAQLETERDATLRQRGRLEGELARVTTQLHEAQHEVDEARHSGRLDQHAGLFDEITSSLKKPLALETFSAQREAWLERVRTAEAQRARSLQSLTETLVKAMSKYLQEFPEDASELSASVASLDSFVARADQLRREDLPRHEKKFKERLNDQVSAEIAFLNTELNLETKRIVDKITQLNHALATVEYNRGTRMRLQPRPVQDREIDEFRRALRECLDESLDTSPEASEARFVRIQSLVERLADRERTTWRNKVIDVRNWFDFAAQEVDPHTGAIHSSYDGSSGQSGGEKAKLAFTILVAALAYQFDVDPHGDTPGRFHFVVVDEMFSKVDDQNAEYALRLFEQFGLQLLIVAPLDAKARVTEPFVDRYLQTVKDPATSRSQLFSMTAQEYEEVVKHFGANGTNGASPKRRVSAK